MIVFECETCYHTAAVVDKGALLFDDPITQAPDGEWDYIIADGTLGQTIEVLACPACLEKWRTGKPLTVHGNFG